LYPVVRTHVLGPARRYKARLVVGNSLRAADLVLARSRSAGAEVVDVFQVEEDRIAIAYCGVDPAFAAVPRQPRPRIERILYSGALTRDKGIFDAIEARGVERQVTLLGRLGRDGLLEQLAWADVALQPSRAESFGLAVAEAQAAGLPVVAYEAGAVPEVVVHGRTGWLTPVGDTGRLSLALETVMADAERCRTMGLAGRARTTDRFTWSESAAAMLRAIDHALAGRSQNRR
jgi:glycosyltransferase involved in cell wall biosynthesis